MPQEDCDIRHVIAFLAFLVPVVMVSVVASRREETSADYFLARRRLRWWLIDFSLIASNISTEHSVGMAGRGWKPSGRSNRQSRSTATVYRLATGGERPSICLILK